METTSVANDTKPMYLTPRFWITAFLMLIIGILLIQSVGWNNLINSIAKTWPLGVFSVFFIYSIVMLIRTYRWHVLLKINGTSVSFLLLARVAWMAWAQNGILPARLGEASRLVILKSYGIGYSKNTTSIALEKFLDLIGLVSVVGLMSLIIAFFHADVTEITNLKLTIYVLLVLIALGFVFLFLIFHYPSFFQNMLSKTKFTNRFVSLFNDVTSSVGHLVKNKWTFVSLVFLSIMQWFTESLTIYFIALILGVPNNITFIMFAAVIGYATYILPVTPGSFGPFELFVGQILLILLNIPASLALSVPIVSHVLVVLYLAITGIISSLTLPPHVTDK